MTHRSGSQRLEARKASLERHAAETDPEIVLNAAARFLEARSRSVAEVRRHLGAAAFQPSLVEGAIARLLEMGMLDDHVFATAWVESRDRARPRGQGALKRELALKGVDRETVAAVLGERNAAAHDHGDDGDPDGLGRFGGGAAGADEAAAERLLSKSRSALLRVQDERARRQRAYALLARKGFDPEICRVLSTRFTSTDGEPDE
jgi:regulatory protein